MRRFLILMGFLGAFALGMSLEHYRMSVIGGPIGAERLDLISAGNDPLTAARTAHSQPLQISCPPPGHDLMVLLTAGQSNAANYGQGHYRPGSHVYQFHAGKCYQATDPLLGASGNGGAVWGRVADGIVGASLAKDVLIAAVAVEGTPVQRWSPKGDLYPRLLLAAGSLADAGYKISYILWHQGESNHAALLPTTREEYLRHFGSMLDGLRSAGIDAPVFVAVASRCVESGPDPEIAAAQAALPRSRPDILPGPDTDVLAGSAFRYDGCHFSEAGMQRHAELWVEAMKKQLSANAVH